MLSQPATPYERRASIYVRRHIRVAIMVLALIFLKPVAQCFARIGRARPISCLRAGNGGTVKLQSCFESPTKSRFRY